MSNVNIAVVSDNNLAFAIATLLVNLLDVKNQDTFINFYAIVSPDFTEENAVRIKGIENAYPNSCKINIIKMDNRFESVNGANYISNACAYKMVLAEKLSDLEKVLYLDLDTIVFEDLSELFETDISDYYAAGVFSINQYCKHSKTLPQRLGIPDLTTYVNAGVLLYNLKLIREEKVDEKMLNLLGSFDDSVDQHIFNKVCYGKIKLLPCKYNFTQSNEIGCKQDKFLYAMRADEYLEALNTPVIYHYTWYMKPWDYANLKYSVLWQRYYNKTAWKDEKREYKNLDWKQIYNSKSQKSADNSEKKKLTVAPLPPKVTFAEKLFSVKNRYDKDKKIGKVIRLLGIKLSFISKF